jgi:mannose-1-phosphate guanylyltransferase
MKGVILVGGEGTRLRPLTVNRPKSMVPIANEPFLARMIRYLKAGGIDEIILAMGYLPDRIRAYFGEGESLGVRLVYSVEESPLGTAGAVKLAAPYIGGETCFVFNGDVLTDLDLDALLRFHRARRAQVTIALSPVDNPSIYGVVETATDGRIRRFIEKPPPEEVTTNLINAGTYVMEPEVLDRIPPGEFYMYEHGVFPGLLEAGAPLYAFASDCYWIDIGTPAKYLSVNQDLLEGRVRRHGEAVRPPGPGTVIDREAEVRGPVVLGADCRIEAGARLIGPSALSDGCVVERGATVEASVLWEGARAGAGAVARGAILGRRTILRGQVLDGAVIGDEAVVEADNILAAGARLWPGAHLPPRTITF